VLEAPSGVSRALHAELDERAGCYRAQVVLAEVRAHNASWAAGPACGWPAWSATLVHRLQGLLRATYVMKF